MLTIPPYTHKVIIISDNTCRPNVFWIFEMQVLSKCANEKLTKWRYFFTSQQRRFSPHPLSVIPHISSETCITRVFWSIIWYNLIRFRDFRSQLWRGFWSSSRSCCGFLHQIFILSVPKTHICYLRITKVASKDCGYEIVDSCHVIVIGSRFRGTDGHCSFPIFLRTKIVKSNNSATLVIYRTTPKWNLKQIEYFCLIFGVICWRKSQKVTTSLILL